jgi:hypothetical protein
MSGRNEALAQAMADRGMNAGQLARAIGVLRTTVTTGAAAIALHHETMPTAWPSSSAYPSPSYGQPWQNPTRRPNGEHASTGWPPRLV